MFQQRVDMTAAIWLCLFLVALIVGKAFRVACDRELRKLPGPTLSAFTGIPLKLAVLGGKRTVYIHRLHRKYGPFVRIAPSEVAVADINAWRKIHKIGSNFNKSSWYKAQSPLQDTDDKAGVFIIINNKTAAQRRRLFQSAGTKNVVAEWESEVVEFVRMTVASIRQELLTSGRCDVMKWWTFMTSDILGSLAFGETFNNVRDGKKSQLVLDIETIMPYIALRIEFRWLGWLMDVTPKALMGRYAPPWDRSLMYGRKALRNMRAAAERGKHTLFSKMVNEDGKNRTIPDSVVEQDAFNIIVAGTDTTAMTLTYLVYYVMRDEKIKTRLIAALQDVPAHARWSDLEKVDYLRHVIQETLRMQPALPGSLPREVPSGGEYLEEHFIPAGTTVSTQAFTFHHDARVFKDPLSFKPDRWNTPTSEMKEHFMPWGGPARSCLGMHIAWLEMYHAVFAFFRECASASLAPSTTDESMETIDYFTIKPKGGVCEIIA